MQEFEGKKSRFFVNLGYSLRESIKLQMKFGLFEKKLVEEKPNKKIFVKTLERKHQAPEHMLVVTARSQVLGEWLGLSSETKRKLALAASMHDAFKAREHEITKLLNFTWEGFEIAESEETQKLQELGISQELIDLVHAGGHPLNEAQKKLTLTKPTKLDWAWMIIFYVDNYTSGVSWAGESPIEERFERDRARYPGFDDSAVGKIDGHPEEKGFSALIRVGKEVQEKIARRLSDLSGQDIEPNKLPRLIDEEIRLRIGAISID